MQKKTESVNDYHNALQEMWMEMWMECGEDANMPEWMVEGKPVCERIATSVKNASITATQSSMLANNSAIQRD